MDISNLEQVINLLADMESNNPDVEKRLAESIVNTMSIPYFRMESDERIIADILGFETRKLADDIYRVEKVFDPGMEEIVPVDLLIAPQKIQKRLDIKDIPAQVKLWVLRISSSDVKLFEKKVEVNLLAEERNDICKKGMQYLKVADFTSIDESKTKINQTLILDLRLNRGGRIAEMMTAYEMIFGSKMRMFQNKKDNSLNFRADRSEPFKTVYLIVDRITCSSAEIFAGIAQEYVDAILVGTKMYGKDMICKRKQFGSFILHVPETKFYIGNRSVKEIEPDYLVDNICEYNAEEILDLCYRLDHREEQK